MPVLSEEIPPEKIDPQLWRQILVLARPYRRYLWGLIFTIVIVAVGDTIFPYLTKIAVDSFVIPQTTVGIGKFGLFFVLLIAVQAFNVYFFISLAGKVESGLAYTLRQEVFQHLQRLSFSFFDTKAVGWIMARLTSDINRLSEIVSWGLVDLFWGVAAMIAYLAAMFSLNWRLALLSLTVLPFMATISIYFQKRILRAHRQARESNSKISAAYNEGITGATTTKILGREEKNLEEFRVLTESLRVSGVKAAILSALFMPLVLTLASVGTALTLWSGGTSVLTETISYGVLVAFISYTVQFFEPVQGIARVFAELQMAHASAERVLGLLNTKPEIKDEARPNSQWPPLKGAIRFENVFFAYNPGEPILENFSLDVVPGQTIALVGATGSGKSTIVNLACRFYEPTKGRILIDGIDYRRPPLAWLQGNLGYVLQSPHLFSGTILDNIRYGNLQASEQEVQKAAKLVNAHHFIQALPRRYLTEVGEGGGLLSTGEKQLVSFARAILANPRIFVLDEATSSVDTETEQLIQKAIQTVLKGRTSFIIAHRLSTIRSADLILVIENGRIKERGTHEELIRNKGHYYRLYTNQFSEAKRC